MNIYNREIIQRQNRIISDLTDIIEGLVKSVYYTRKEPESISIEENNPLSQKEESYREGEVKNNK